MEDIPPQNLNCCPIIGETRTFGYKAANIFFNYLRPSWQNKCSMLDTQQFSNMLSDLPLLLDNEEDVYYDLESLFTNIPIKLNYRLNQISNISSIKFEAFRILKHFAPRGIFGLGKISTFLTISSLYMLNCFKIFSYKYLERKCLRILKRIIWTILNFIHNFLCQSDKIFVLCLVFVWQNIRVLRNCKLLMH